MQIQIQQEHRLQIARKYTTQAEIQKFIIQIQMSSAQAKIQQARKLQATLVRNYRLLTDGGEV